MDGIDTFESPLLADVQINADGTLKQSGKQNVKFSRRKRLSFKARPLWVKDDDGQVVLDAAGKPIQAKDEKGKKLFDIDPRTGIPFKDAFEELVEFIRVETRGDTNIKEDVADAMAKRQFHRQYKFFREGKIPDGHSIEDFEFLQPGTILELHMFGIATLEQVAEMDDVSCEQIKDQSGFKVRDIARQWITINAPDSRAGRVDRLELELAKLKAENETLRGNGKRPRLVKEVEPETEQETPVETLELSPEQLTRGPGRPRKV